MTCAAEHGSRRCRRAAALCGLAALLASGCSGRAEAVKPPPDSPTGEAPVAASSASAGSVAPTASAAASVASPGPDGGSLPDAAPWTAPGPGVRAVTEWAADRSLGGKARAEQAKQRRLPVVRQLFDAAGVHFPPAQLLLRAYKRERRLEVWAPPKTGEPFRAIASYEICSASGRLGPKRRQGDGQVPEGFYTLSDFNPSTPYHLGLLLSYPNGSDRILGDRRDPGSEIMIHGDCVSAGCLAMSDERSEELWVMATSVHWSGGKVYVHLFPTDDVAQLLEAGVSPEHHELWRNLEQGRQIFERERRLPAVRIDGEGRYLFH